MLPYLLLLSSLSSSAFASCSSHPPTDGDYEVLAVGTDSGSLTSILNEARDEGVVGLAMTSPKEECDVSCLYTLEHHDPPHHYSSLVVRKELSEFIPFEYTRNTNRSTVYCARSKGVCGATVPVWRHFLLNGTGLYHTYTLDNSMVDGYTRETVPLCFVWASEDVDQEGSGVGALLSSDERLKRDSELVKNNKTCDVYFANRTSMEMLSEFKNNRTESTFADETTDGSELDHLYTLKTSKELAGYNKTKDLGLILTKNDSSCSCLVALVQTMDNQTGVFHRIDHKLMRADAELNRIFEKYNRTGETFYCAAKKGQCGASIPLYKHFDYVHIDSIITTSDKEVPPTSYRYPPEPLCWIWSIAYDPSEGEVTVKTTIGRVKRTTTWEDYYEETTDGWNTTNWTNYTVTSPTTRVTPQIPSNTTRITTSSVNGTTRASTVTSKLPSSTVRVTSPMGNSTVRSTVPPSASLALDEIIVGMVRSALVNNSNWKDAVRTKLRDISERI